MSKKYPDIEWTEELYKNFSVFYYSRPPTSGRLIGKFYREYWQQNKKMPTTVEYKEFLVRERLIEAKLIMECKNENKA